MRNAPGFSIINFLFLTFVLALSAIAAETKPNAETKSLYALFENEWQHALKENPTFASFLGDRRYNDLWPDLSLAEIDREHEHAIGVLAQLKKINRAKLSPKDQLNYDLFKKQWDNAVEEYQYRFFLVPLNQREGIQTQDDLANSLRFETVKDYEDWTARMNSFPTMMDQTIGLMRQGIKEKIVQPKITMQRVPAQIDKQITDTPQASPFYQPFKEFASGISKPDQERLRGLAQTVIRDRVIPAYRKFKQFFTGEYLPACFDEVGAWQLPNGNAYYAFAARRFTTTSLTPGQIHQLGLSEVARIRSEMETLKKKIGFDGTLHDVFKHLRSDPKFFCKTPDELMTRYLALSKRIDPNLVKIAKVFPRMPYGVRAIPDNIAPDTTTAYYNQPAADGSRAGTFYVNLYKPETRPTWEMMALALHEAVPGHHFQIAIAMEQGVLPNFRRYGEGYTAFIEGWGLYAESLGEDMGLYSDPYDKFGQLTYEMWRAVRLVVDTGMHYHKWSRQKAIDYFLDNAAKTELDVVNEIDRYISWPGQALAYKIGELKIKELRARSSRELGAKFDLREYDDAVLEAGPIPLDILERNIDEYIMRKK